MLMTAPLKVLVLLVGFSFDNASGDYKPIEPQRFEGINAEELCVKAAEKVNPDMWACLEIKL